MKSWERRRTVLLPLMRLQIVRTLKATPNCG